MATFRTGTCSVAKGQSPPPARESVDIRIRHFKGYNVRPFYEISGYKDDPYAVIRGPGGPYSTLFRAPGHFSQLGGIGFYPQGKYMSFGVKYAWNASGKRFVFPLGWIACKRPRR